MIKTSVAEFGYGRKGTQDTQRFSSRKTITGKNVAKSLQIYFELPSDGIEKIAETVEIFFVNYDLSQQIILQQIDYCYGKIVSIVPYSRKF